MSAKSAEQEITHDVAVFKKYRNLLAELTRKNIKLKYRNSWLGIFWSFLQPLLNMIVLSVVFGGIFGKHSKYAIRYFFLQDDYCLTFSQRQPSRL